MALLPGLVRVRGQRGVVVMSGSGCGRSHCLFTGFTAIKSRKLEANVDLFRQDADMTPVSFLLN